MPAQLAIRRHGTLIEVSMKGRIEAVPFPKTARLSAPGAVIGDGVTVDLRLSAEEAWKAGEMLKELARQAEKLTRALVTTPQ